MTMKLHNEAMISHAHCLQNSRSPSVPSMTQTHSLTLSGSYRSTALLTCQPVGDELGVARKKHTDSMITDNRVSLDKNLPHYPHEAPRRLFNRLLGCLQCLLRCLCPRPPRRPPLGCKHHLLCGCSCREVQSLRSNLLASLVRVGKVV
jgi:hypothetical protein